MATETAGRSLLRRRLLKELLIFSSIVIVLAMLWHPDLLHSPLTRAERLTSTSQVSFWHPLMWSAGIYLFAGIIRLLLTLVRKLQGR